MLVLGVHLLDGLAREDTPEGTPGHPANSLGRPHGGHAVADSTPAPAPCNSRGATRRGHRPDDLDFVKLRPVLARDEQPLGSRVVGDAVQHRFAVARALRIQRAQVDEPEHLASRRRDARDAIVVPNVRPDLAVDVLELVQLRHRRAVGAHLDLARDGERLRIAETDRRRAVAHDELPAVVSEPPPFAVVLHRALDFERLEVVHDDDAVLPRELIQAGRRESRCLRRSSAARARAAFRGDRSSRSTRRTVDAPYWPVPS